MPPTITGRKTEPLRPTSDLDSPTRRQLSHHATPLGINLGIDFGTKFTKVCFRDIARNASSVISFAGLTVTQPEDAMLPSRLCIDDESNVTSGLRHPNGADMMIPGLTASVCQSIISR